MARQLGRKLRGLAKAVFLRADKVADELNSPYDGQWHVSKSLLKVNLCTSTHAFIVVIAGVIVAFGFESSGRTGAANRHAGG